MCPPGLHITLGVFYRLFVLLENAAHELDLRYAVDSVQAVASYERQIGLIQEQTQLKDKELHHSQLVRSLTNHMILLVSNLPGTRPTAPNQQITDLWVEVQRKNKELNEMVSLCQQIEHRDKSYTMYTQREKIDKLEKDMEKGLRKKMGHSYVLLKLP